MAASCQLTAKKAFFVSAAFRIKASFEKQYIAAGKIMDKAFAEEMRRRIEKELQERELATIQYWKEEAEKIVRKPSESLSALQVELKNLITRMETRLRTLKKSGF
jgi:hypothetical protein